MGKINIAEILKDCPRGTKLYSPLCGTCVFDRLNMGTIICKKQNTGEITFTSEGYYMLPVFDDCECMLFPSKDQRDWNKFQGHFKDGDIVATTNGIWIGITTSGEIGKFMPTYCVIQCDGRFEAYLDGCKNTWSFARFATEEEKRKLFDAIKENGYKWNAETKTLEKLVEPKFKIGDVIKDKVGHNVEIIQVNIDDECYEYITKASGIGSILFKEQDDWELVPEKFDITTLVPFETKVLVRDSESQIWRPAIWGYYAENCGNHFQNYLHGVVGGSCWKYCIPYEGNEHLRGKTDDCEEFYKTWKD